MMSLTRWLQRKPDLEGYKLVPENRGQIKEAVFVAHGYQNSIPTLKSFLDNTVSSLMIVAADTMNVRDGDRPLSTLDDLRELSEEYEGRVELSVVEIEGPLSRVVYFGKAREELWSLQSSDGYTVFPGGGFSTPALSYIEPRSLDILPFGERCSRVVPVNDSIFYRIHNSDVIVTSDVVMVDFHALMGIINSSRKVREVLFGRKTITSVIVSHGSFDEVESKLDELTPVVQDELAPYLEGQDVVLLPAQGDPYLRLDQMIAPYASRGFFVGPGLPDEDAYLQSHERKSHSERYGDFLARLRDHVEVTDFPMDLGYGLSHSGTCVHGCDISVLQEGNRVFVPDRPTRSGRIRDSVLHPKMTDDEYAELQQQHKELWESKGLKVVPITYTLDNSYGMRDSFQVLRRTK